MHAELFPATFDKQMTTYPFQVLKKFELHNLESKQSEYNYCGSLMQLTGNAFPVENVTVPPRLWGTMTTEKRMGIMHGISAVIPHRPEGNSIFICPACPEPGFNMDKHMTCQLPEELRLAQLTHIWRGRQNLRRQVKLLAICKVQGNNVLQQKSTCNYLKVVNNQDKKKFKNTEVTGDVNTQCSHVFVRASVDLEFGER
ncbi:hypothetical protein B0H17DRAFT_946965 [Mycena rosella]|uniref:CxC2-like cysteine cluster KDZ transposase-associated domain-containing protein n=1 Tax=Mycena rosella TaxID=1033263 RepID=A0AAD7D139_MYCRO|nr:hypothetical protein B0H17DRAFT_946965 [Mycena rosella]